MKTLSKPRIRTTDFVDDPRKRFKDHDLRICTWNVRTLHRPGAIQQLENVLVKYKAEIIALQEMRIPGNGRLQRQSCDLF